MNAIAIPIRTDAEWLALLESWRTEARNRIAAWRATPHKYEPNYELKERRK